jgi:hypothetical protein
MRHELRIDLPLLGHRTYIQGGSIFNGMLEACDRTLGADWLDGVTIASFKIQRESGTDGRFVIADEPVHGLDEHANMAAQGPSGQLHVYLVDEGRRPPHEPYNESEYYDVIRVGADLSGEFALAPGRPRADFMRGVVGANKLLHERTGRFGGELKRIQFLYLKGLAAECLQRSANGCRLHISNVMVQDHGNEVWTINRVRVEGAAVSSSFRICYRAAR